MAKKFLGVFLSMVLIISLLPNATLFAASDTQDDIKAFDEVWGRDISGLDLKGKGDILPTLTFNSDQKWPSRDNMPSGFEPQKIINWGKNPGLGIRKLHQEGLTGKGVNVAYIDQPLLEGHVEYKDRNIKYFKIRPETLGMDTSMHGPAVLSLLAGKDIGVAPDSTVYFFGHPAWLGDQRTHAEALRKLIEVNKTLPQEKKIKVVGLSDGVDETEKYPEEFEKAIEEAENSGIMVITVNDYFQLAPLYVSPQKDKEDFNNYEVAHWAGDWTDYSGRLFVPSSGRTTANGVDNNTRRYTYWSNGGLSWTVPYIVGVIALGLQVDPTLTKEDIVRYLKDSGIPYKGGKIINPEGFIQLVRQNRIYGKDYYYILYNTKKISADDLDGIKLYAGTLSGKTVFVDTAEYSDATSIYDALSQQSRQINGNIKGVMIFGLEQDVPAFDVHFKIQMQDSIDDSGNFKSDFFYSSFKNDSALLKNDFSIYKAFNEKLKVNFIPEWPVARLPLGKGEIVGFLKKYVEYVSARIKQKEVPLVNFSNPIFAQKEHSDDMGYFIKERLDKEFKALNAKQYRLYGNKQGYYPVTSPVLGDYTKENIKGENGKGIADFLINTHGQNDNIDQAIFESAESSSEKRISFLNSTDINQVLSSNYYTLTLWSCLNGYGLGKENIVHEAMANGKCMNAIAASSILSNNGINCRASLEDMKKNNPFYLQYAFYNSLFKLHNTRSQSFFLAKKAYSTEILKNTDKLGEGNYQFNLHNVLAQHFFGLLEYPAEKNVALEKIVKKLGDGSGKPINDTGEEDDFLSFKDNQMTYKEISHIDEQGNDPYSVTYAGTATDDKNLYLKIQFTAAKDSALCIFLQGDAPGLSKFYPKGVKTGENLLIFKFDKQTLLSYTAGLALYIGEGSYIYFDKDELFSRCQ